MARRPDSQKPEILSKQDLAELRRNVAMLSIDAVRGFTGEPTKIAG